MKNRLLSFTRQSVIFDG